MPPPGLEPMPRTSANNLATQLCTVSSVADPDPGSGAFLTPGPGMGKKSVSGSVMNNRDHISESLETIFLG